MYTSVQTLTNSITSTVYVSVTTVTTITLPSLTTDQIDVWNVQWTDIYETIIYFTSSLIFPPVIMAQSPDIIQTGTRSTTLAGRIYTYSPVPYPDQTSTTTKPPPPPPPSGSIGSVHVSSGSPKPTCISGCGHACKFFFQVQFPCIGICDCIGPGCPGGGSCAGAGCGSNPDEENSSSCTDIRTITDCQVDCSITDFGTSTTRTCYSTSCVTAEACSTTGFTTTSETTTFACPWTTVLASAVWQPDDPEALPPLLGGGGAFGYTYITASGLTPPRLVKRSVQYTHNAL